MNTELLNTIANIIITGQFLVLRWELVYLLKVFNSVFWELLITHFQMTISSRFLKSVFTITNAKIQFGFKGTLRHPEKNLFCCSIKSIHIFGTPKTPLKCLTTEVKHSNIITTLTQKTSCMSFQELRNHHSILSFRFTVQHPR